MRRCSATGCICACEQGQPQAVVGRLPQAITAQGGEVSTIRPIQAGLEDVFIALLEDQA